MKRYLNIAFLFLILVAGNSQANSVSNDILASYKSAGAGPFSAEAGAQMWLQTFNNNRSCSSCHMEDVSQAGKHVKTKKVIKPMALSVNSDRYTDSKKVAKWFKRNCKWTLGRECSAQEKGDFLTWLLNQ